MADQSNDVTEELFPTRNVFRGDNTRQGVYNSDGSISTERTITVVDPRLNDGKPTNIPSMYGGKEVDQDTAVDLIMKNGGVDPETGRELQGFNSIEDAVEAAKSRSDSLSSWMLPESEASNFSDLAGPTKQDTQMGNIEFGMQLWPYLNWVGKLGFDAEKTHIFDREKSQDSEFLARTSGVYFPKDSPYFKSGHSIMERGRDDLNNALVGRKITDAADKVMVQDTYTRVPETYAHEYMHRGLDILSELVDRFESVTLRGDNQNILHLYGDEVRTDEEQELGFLDYIDYDTLGDTAHREFIYPEITRIRQEGWSAWADRGLHRDSAKRFLYENGDEYDLEHIDAMNEIAKRLYKEYNTRKPEEQEKFKQNLYGAIFGDSDE